MTNGANSSRGIPLPATEVPLGQEADVIVVGGGPSGFGAALRAARAGAQTLLVERFGSPGGNITAGMMPCAGFGPVGRIHTEFWERLKREGFLFDIKTLYPNNPLYHHYPGYYGMYGFNPDTGACIMTQMLEEAGVRLLFRTLFVGTKVRSGPEGASRPSKGKSSSMPQAAVIWWRVPAPHTWSREMTEAASFLPG